VIVGVALLALALFAPRPAEASLSVFQTYVGNYGVSTDGFGSTTQSGTISASIPAGATVVGAYLYTSTYFNNSPSGIGGTLNGQAVNYATNLGTTSACCTLTAFRADVTSIVQAGYTGNAPGDIYNFNITETSIAQDGEALVVVYQLGSLPVSTIGILDGFSATTGDSTSINFADPLDPTQADFFAEMRLGIGFSAGGTQFSEVRVNSTLITGQAGGFDDGAAANRRGADAKSQGPGGVRVRQARYVIHIPSASADGVGTKSLCAGKCLDRKTARCARAENSGACGREDSHSSAHHAADLSRLAAGVPQNPGTPLR
jgi:hypothetical protein